MSPFAPRSSFAPTSLHLIMPIKWTRGWRGGGWGGGNKLSFLIWPHSLPTVHVSITGKRFDLNNNVATLSCQQVAEAPSFLAGRFYLGLVTSHTHRHSAPKKLKMSDSSAASAEPHTLSCSWVFTVRSRFFFLPLNCEG